MINNDPARVLLPGMAFAFSVGGSDMRVVRHVHVHVTILAGL